MVQGDAYDLVFSIDSNDEPLDISLIESVEVTLPRISKLYPDEITYSKGLFYLPLSQKETFWLPERCPIQIRVKFKGSGHVIGSNEQMIDVHRSLSKRVL